MSELKDDIATERDALRERVGQLEEENATLRAGAPAVGRASVPQHQFVLSEGDRQELELNGRVNIGGKLLTKADVVAKMAAADNGGRNDQSGVEISDPEPGSPAALNADRVNTERARVGGRGVEGVDYVWPSVAPGEIDPAVAGTPGISGPAADTDRA